ncbi:MAG: apolipoprotein N-acyltransferase [Janthinobacterium lividum]
MSERGRQALAPERVPAAPGDTRGALGTGPLGRLRRGLWLLAGWRADLVALGLGALSALALPPLGVLPVLLVSFPALLTLIDAAPRARTAFRRGYVFGFGHHLVGLYWITEAILVKADQFWWLVPFAVPVTAAGLAPFIALPCAASRLAPAGWRRALLLAGLWTLADIARQFVLTGFPWNPLGSVWALSGPLGDIMIQPASAVGVHGLTLATLLVAMTPVLGRRAVLGGVAVLLSWAGFGIVRLAKPEPPAPGVVMVLAQGNVSEAEKHDRAWAVATFRHYLDLTRQGMAQAVPGVPADAGRVVIWPETASPFLLTQDDNARVAIADAARGGGVPALASLVGTVRFDAAERPRNSLVTILPGGAIAAAYDKSHLVPFGEYVPSWLPLLQLVPGGGFAPGPGIVTQHVAGLPPFGVLICYETIFPSQVVDEADRPDWLVEVTNDAWFGLGTGPRQHLAAGRMRAVEEGLPLVRAANTGISAAFDSLGREQGRLGLQVAGTLVLPLPGHLRTTAYARLGLLTPILLSLAMAGLGLGMGRRKAAAAFRI